MMAENVQLDSAAGAPESTKGLLEKESLDPWLCEGPNEIGPKHSNMVLKVTRHMEFLAEISAGYDSKLEETFRSVVVHEEHFLN